MTWNRRGVWSRTPAVSRPLSREAARQGETLDTSVPKVLFPVPNAIELVESPCGCTQERGRGRGVCIDTGVLLQRQHQRVLPGWRLASVRRRRPEDGDKPGKEGGGAILRARPMLARQPGQL